MTARRSGDRDRGSATIYAITVIAVLAAIALGAAAVGGAVVARHRAMAAADLAALAAADALAHAAADPCAAAEHIAARHDVDLRSCSTDGLVADVKVGVPVRGVLGFGLVAEMRSRAGPAAGDPGAGRLSGPPTQWLAARGDSDRAAPARARSPTDRGRTPRRGCGTTERHGRAGSFVRAA